ncbi:MAG: TlpA family protein disulfide reductase [Deltaproteobacteria bacterium]|nr:TlpA family protein disulfide reductase [Deltaproteobacteria bacterium]
MRRHLLLLLPLALAAACATSTAAQGRHAATEAADFTLRTIDGTTFTLSEHLGKKVLVLDFWATWCVPCLAAMPHLQAMSERYRDELLVIGISMDGPETVAQVGPTAATRGVRFPILLDEETRAVSVYNPHRSAPYTVLIGKDGRVASAREGYNSGDEVMLEKAVQELIAKAAQPPPAAAPQQLQEQQPSPGEAPASVPAASSAP